MPYNISQKTAKRFFLIHHGLINPYRFTGKEGAYEYIKKSGCIQFDPVDICGKNPELVLQSRIKGFRKKMLYDMLYKDRVLVDHFDKQLAIYPIEDWPYLHQNREESPGNHEHEEIKNMKPAILGMIREKGPLCSQDLKMDQKIDWYWAPAKLSRATLEHLYIHGELVVHHKRGSQKYYDLAEKHIDAIHLNAESPFESSEEYYRWHILRRIRSVGMLRNGPSDAFLGIHKLKAKSRSLAFEQLLSEGLIKEVVIEGNPYPLYISTNDIKELEVACSELSLKPRLEFIAPLDNLIWDRKLIKDIFGFDYKWEIYTPKEKLKYAHYTLPVLFGTEFVGRAEIICDRKNSTLRVKSLWLENRVKQTKRLHTAFLSACKRFAKFNECKELDISESLYQ